MGRCGFTGRCFDGVASREGSSIVRGLLSVEFGVTYSSSRLSRTLMGPVVWGAGGWKWHLDLLISLQLDPSAAAGSARLFCDSVSKP